MSQKHKPFRQFRTPFSLRDIRENPRSNVRACAAGDGAICSKNRKIVPYHGDIPNTRNDARLRSPFPLWLLVSQNTIFVSMNVTSLYTTIPQDERSQPCVTHLHNPEIQNAPVFKRSTPLNCKIINRCGCLRLYVQQSAKKICEVK